MFERWRKNCGTYIHEYQIIDPLHHIAAERTLSPDGKILSIKGAAKELINGDLTPEKLKAKGYELYYGE